jgi:hypothetical protein
MQKTIRRTFLVLVASAGLATLAETASAGSTLLNHCEPFTQAR